MPRLRAKAESLVRTRIRGSRKGNRKEPAFEHSFRVAAILASYGYGETVQLAGLLHDVVEDGGVTFPELRRLGFPKRTIALVRLCTHDARIKNRDARWELMIARLITAADADAWAVKLADTLDNYRSSALLAPDRAAFFRGVKAPLVLHVTHDLMRTTPLWKELGREIGRGGKGTLPDFLDKVASIPKRLLPKQFFGMF